MVSTSTPRSIVIIRLCFVLLGISNVYLTVTLFQSSENIEKHYTYLGDDFPAELEVPGLNSKVTFTNEEQTVHYQLSSSIAEEEWASLLPNTAILVRLGPQYRPFAITMLHTLHCLDKLRHSILIRPRNKIGRFHVEHCANYVRESILCSADATLEPVDERDEEHNRVLPVTRECRDWSAVYQEILRNHESFVDAAVTVPY